MSLSGIQRTVDTAPALPVGKDRRAARSAGQSSTAKPVRDAQLSRRGQFMNRLQELAKTDPAQARQLVGDLAAKIRGEAAQGGANSDRRMALADMLQKAADSGDFSLLESGASGASPAGGSPAMHAYGQAMAMTRSSR